MDGSNPGRINYEINLVQSDENSTMALATSLLFSALPMGQFPLKIPEVVAADRDHLFGADDQRAVSGNFICLYSASSCPLSHKGQEIKPV